MESLNENQSFCTLLQSGLQDFKDTPFQPKMKSTKKANFSIEEDIVQVKAWLNTSMDPIQGNGKKSQQILG
jgi:hypothetical protein